MTSGADKVVKVWDVANNTPTCLHSEEAKLVCVTVYYWFCRGFLHDGAPALKSASVRLFWH